MFGMTKQKPLSVTLTVSSGWLMFFLQVALGIPEGRFSRDVPYPGVCVVGRDPPHPFSHSPIAHSPTPTCLSHPWTLSFVIHMGAQHPVFIVLLRWWCHVVINLCVCIAPTQMGLCIWPGNWTSLMYYCSKDLYSYMKGLFKIKIKFHAQSKRTNTVQPNLFCTALQSQPEWQMMIMIQRAEDQTPAIH